MDLRHLGTVWEGLAVAGNAGEVGVDHHGISEDRSDQLVVLMTDGDQLPAFVSPELREREPSRHFQGVLVLLAEGYAAEDGEQYCDDHDPLRMNFASWLTLALELCV